MFEFELTPCKMLDYQYNQVIDLHNKPRKTQLLVVLSPSKLAVSNPDQMIEVNMNSC